MTSFASIVAGGVKRVYARFGEAATYTSKTGATTPVTVVVERNLAQYGQVATVMGKTAVVNVLKSELAVVPRRSETFTLEGGEVLTVDTILSSDEIEHKVVTA